MGYLRPESIHILKTNPGKYTVQNDSWAQEKLEVFWEYVTNFIPPWISANAITIASIFPLFPFVLYAFIQPPPMPILYQALASLAIFFFQTMDGVDGIHARRCKTCSPLGDLLDHIIDQVCALCCVIVCASSLGFVLDAFILVFLTNCALMSFMVHWQTTHTKLLVFQNGSSIIEAQLGMIALNLVAPIAGQQIWDICPFAFIPYSPEFLTVFKLNQITAVVVMVIPTPAVITAAISVYRLKGFGVFREVVPLILMIAMNVHWFVADRNGATSMTVAHGITCINTWYCVCFTLLHRITQQPLKWYSTLHILVPGALIPFVPDQYKFNAYYIFLAYSSVVFTIFLLSILRTFSNALGVPLLAQSKDAYQRLKSKQ